MGYLRHPWQWLCILLSSDLWRGHAVAYLVGALCYKPEGPGSIPDEIIEVLNWPNPFSLTMALGSTQPLAKMSTRNFLAGKGRPEPKADNFTAICEPIFKTVWEPRHLTTQRVSMACYRDSLALARLITPCILLNIHANNPKRRQIITWLHGVRSHKKVAFRIVSLLYRESFLKH
jgi:hypothetical protein